MTAGDGVAHPVKLIIRICFARECELISHRIGFHPVAVGALTGESSHADVVDKIVARIGLDCGLPTPRCGHPFFTDHALSACLVQ